MCSETSLVNCTKTDVSLSRSRLRISSFTRRHLLFRRIFLPQRRISHKWHLGTQNRQKPPFGTFYQLAKPIGLLLVPRPIVEVYVPVSFQRTWSHHQIRSGSVSERKSTSRLNKYFRSYQHWGAMSVKIFPMNLQKQQSLVWCKMTREQRISRSAALVRNICRVMSDFRFHTNIHIYAAEYLLDLITLCFFVILDICIKSVDYMYQLLSAVMTKTLRPVISM